MESLYEGRLFTCTVVGIMRRKPPREVLDQANPVQDEYTRLWKCPFCLRDDFRDIGMVREGGRDKGEGGRDKGEGGREEYGERRRIQEVGRKG